MKTDKSQSATKKESKKAMINTSSAFKWSTSISHAAKNSRTVHEKKLQEKEKLRKVIEGANAKKITVKSFSWDEGPCIYKCCIFHPKRAPVSCFDFSDWPSYCEVHSSNKDIFIIFLFAALLLKNQNLLFKTRKIS